MSGLARAALGALLVLIARPAAAQDQSPVGRWALHAGGRTLLILTLSRTRDEIGYWTGSIVEPRRIRWSGGTGGYGFDGVEGPAVERPMRPARPMSGGVAIVLAEAVPGQPDAFHFTVAADGSGALSVDGFASPPLQLVRAEAGETVAAGNWDAARHYVAGQNEPTEAEMTAILRCASGGARSPAASRAGKPARSIRGATPCGRSTAGGATLTRRDPGRG